MSFLEFVLIGVGLAMDAFAVSICKGLSVRELSLKHGLICAAWFGGFQFLMPVVGYLLGFKFQHLIENFDHWIAFVLLALIGLNMIREALKGEEDDVDADFGIKAMLPLAVATSIDALAIGITFAALSARVLTGAVTIGVLTFMIAFIGVAIGNKFGSRYKAKTEVAGGVVLVLIGLKVLLEHLGVIGF